MQYLIWVCTVCQHTFYGMLGLNGLKIQKMSSLLEFIFSLNKYCKICYLYLNISNNIHIKSFSKAVTNHFNSSINTRLYTSEPCYQKEFMTPTICTSEDHCQKTKIIHCNSLQDNFYQILLTYFLFLHGNDIFLISLWKYVVCTQ